MVAVEKRFSSDRNFLGIALLAALTWLAVPVEAQDPGALSGPIDIQANEQEFAGDQVIAKGNVRVSYKESVIVAPMATLVRDPAGNPQRAVFTGHPKLTQGANSIDANTITFDIANQRIVAEGNAHSEVISQDTGEPGKAEKPDLRQGNKPGKIDKIVTDSDLQEYDRAADKFEAVGHVRVKHSDISVSADRLKLMYGANRKPETAVFTGSVVATQGQNRTSADTITYSLSTKRLQASGHVKSQVVQKPGAAKKGGLSELPGSSDKSTVAGAQSEAPCPEEMLTITSDTQDYSQETGRVAADGNVRVYYKDTVGMGPRVVMVRNAEGKAEKVVFVGRSQVSQPGRRWIADRITVTVADRRVLAEGNTKAFILQMPKTTPSPAQTQLAGRAQSIGATRIETTQ